MIKRKITNRIFHKVPNKFEVVTAAPITNILKTSLNENIFPFFFLFDDLDWMANILRLRPLHLLFSFPFKYPSFIFSFFRFPFCFLSSSIISFFIFFIVNFFYL